MKVITADDDEIVLGTTETRPTISIRDFSRRETDDFGVTRVVKRNFQRLMSVRMQLPFDTVSDVQNSLAALRATAAQWVASEDYDWLNFSGFYKDFSLDLAVPPNSFCTLTVEGLAESEPGVTDAGTDPAPTGASTLKLVQPELVDDSVLVSSNVPETDWPEWSAITIYPSGSRVIKAALHRVYESVVDTNVGNDPAGTSGKWIEVGVTNRWAMFDEALGSATSATGNIVVTVNATAIDSVALLDVDATTVRVQAAGYDETRSAASGSALFLDLPPTDGDITVTVTKSGGASVGTMLIGKLVTLGVTEESPTAGITDYSKKEVDDFGEATIVERAWAKRSELRSLIRTDAIDIVANRVAAVRAQPSLWIGDEAVGALIIYGFFKDFSIEVDQGVSTVSLSIEGLSKAAPISDAGATAVFEKNFYRRSAMQPATPTGGSFDFVTRDIVAPDDWSAAIEDGDDPVWVSIAIAAKTGSGGSAPFTGHTVPVKVFQDGVDGIPGTAGDDGAPGTPGADGVTYYTHYAYADAPDGTFNFTTGSPGDRTYQGVRYNQTSATESTDPDDYLWSPYVGPPNFGLAAFNSNTPIAGNKLIKASGGSAWNASIHSTESFKGGASVSFIVDFTGTFMVGLNTDPTTDASYTSLDFAIYCQGGSNPVQVRQGGSVAFDTGIAAAVGDVFTVTYNGKTVVYSKNGVPFYTNSSPGANLALFLDSSLFTSGFQFGRILSFTAAGPAGADGTNGLNNAIVYLYQRGGTAPSAPTGTFTYTFATGVLSGGTLNGWTQAIPAANGSPLWVIAATASAAATTDSIAAAEFTSPVLKDGAGLNGAPVFLYKRASSAPSVPASTLTYTFATGVLSGTLSGWTQSVPANDGNPVYIITATALGTGTTDTIATGEWSTPQILAANGADGSDGADGTDGISPLLITLSPQSLTVQGAPGGGPASGELPKFVAVTAQRGGVAKTVTAISVTAVSNCTASVSGTNVSLNTAGAGDAEITISVTADGETQTGIKIPVTVVPSGADGDVAATITTNTPQITSSTYAAWSPTLAVNASSTGKLKVSGLCRYRVPLGLGSLQVQAKLQISADGSSWTDVSGSQVTGTTSETLEDPERVVNGVATFPEITVTGLTANGAYQVRAQLRKVSSGDTNSESITLRIVGERVT